MLLLLGRIEVICCKKSSKHAYELWPELLNEQSVQDVVQFVMSELQ
jgi:hypothetical protein